MKIKQTLKEFIEKWDLKDLSINAKVLSATFEFNNYDKKAAWEMYIELLTRITTQELLPNHGDEKTALDSVYSLFSTTRSILKENGTGCIQFSKIAIIILNQKIRPFTAKWHKESLNGAFNDKEKCNEFRNELGELQVAIKNYMGALSDIAGVEDLTSLEEE